MRRAEIQDATYRAIEDHFPEDVFKQFRRDQLNRVAEHFQEVEKEDEPAIDDDIRRVKDNTSGRTWDLLADGVGEFAGNPEGWLLKALEGHLDYGG